MKVTKIDSDNIEITKTESQIVSKKELLEQRQVLENEIDHRKTLLDQVDDFLDMLKG